MNVLHITPSSNGYEKVKLLANRVSSTNHLAVIEDENKEQFITGGFIISDTTEIRTILDNIPKDKQYDFVRDFKIVPFVKAHFEVLKENKIKCNCKDYDMSHDCLANCDFVPFKNES